MNKTLLKYKLGLAVIAVFVLGLLVYVLLQASGNKQDLATTKVASSIADKLMSYTNDKNNVPESLAAVGVTDAPKSITYQKLSSERYKFCVDYKTKSSGSSSSVTQTLLQRGIYGNAGYDPQPYSSTDDSSYLSVDSVHTKGQNCQTIKPYISTGSSYDSYSSPSENAKASGAQDTVCGLSGYSTHYSGTVSAVATADGKPLTPTVTQNLVVSVTPDSDAPAGVQTITLSQNNFNVFNSRCTALSHQSLQSGDAVSVFQNNSSTYIPAAMVDFTTKD